MEDNLASALAKAQAEIGPAAKTGYNPHFKSTFSTLEDLINASRNALTKNGLSVTQYPDSDQDTTYLVTKLKHASGQDEVSKVKIMLKDPTDIQKLGSALSYLKRYTYASICGIATSEGDDDGNEISQPQAYNATSDKISYKKVALLREKIGTRKDIETKICDHYKITSLEQLDWRKFDEVMARLESRQE